MTARYPLYISGYATPGSPGIQGLFFESDSGRLIKRWSFHEILNPSFIVVHPDGRFLYAVSETGQQEHGRSGQVWALALADEQAPQALNMQASGGDYPCHLVFDQTSRWLVVSNYGSGTISVFPVQEDGSLGPASAHIQHHGHGANPERQEGPHTHSAIFSPDNRFLLIADLGLDQIVGYHFDQHTGTLMPAHQTHTPPGSGPRHMAFGPRNHYLYLACELNNTVIAYTYDQASGELSEQQVISTLTDSTQGNAAADIHYQPAYQQLAVSNRGDDSIAVFQVAPTGLLTPTSAYSCAGHWPRNFAIAPEGPFVLVANQYSNEISVIAVDRKGQGVVHTRFSLAGASCVQFGASL